MVRIFALKNNFHSTNSVLGGLLLSNEDAFNLLLPNSVSSVHGLEVLHRVPIVLHENDGISSSQIQTEAT